MMMYEGFNADGHRDTGVLHRSAVTAADKIADFVDASVTIADQATGGSLAFNTAHYVTAIPGNRWGNCKVNANIDTLTTANDAANTHSIRATIAQATGADYYDIFLSIDAAPKWVGRITEAQRAAGDYEITAVGTVAAGGGNPAGTVDINVVGTGIQTTNSIFAQNNAYRPDNTGITAVDCTGAKNAHIMVKSALTDLRSAPTLTLMIFTRNKTSTTDWHQGILQTITLLSAAGKSLEQEIALELVEGAEALKVLVDSIAGQGHAVSIWVEPS